MKNKFLITFAGPMGSSKTPIAYYLSWRLNLPIFSNDSIRAEVVGDLDVFDEQEYIKRRDERLNELIKKEASFIYDASVDRKWVSYKDQLRKKIGYETFIISMDLSRDFLLSLYNKKVVHYKGTSEYPRNIDESIKDHESFLGRYGNEVNLHIDDENFSERLGLAYEGAKKWIEDKQSETI